MKTSIAICSHPRRARDAERLAAQVQAEVIVEDDGYGSEVNHINSWQQLLESDGNWGLVLEDDAIPIPNFKRQLEQVLLNAPTSVVSLYLGRSRPPHYQNSIAQVIGANTPFIVGRVLLSCVAVCVHRDYIPDMLDYVKRQHFSERVQIKSGERNPKDFAPIDEMMSDWTKSLGLAVGYTNPSIVQHADSPTLLEFHPSKYKESDMSSRNEKRVAWRIGERREWTDQTIILPAPGEIVTTNVNSWPMM